jgi:hypothetical protein
MANPDTGKPYDNLKPLIAALVLLGVLDRVFEVEDVTGNGS